MQNQVMRLPPTTPSLAFGSLRGTLRHVRIGLTGPCLLVLVASLPFAAAAAPTDPIVLERPNDALGQTHSVGFRTLADVPEPYVEEEFFVSGTATVYTYEEMPRRGAVLPHQLGVPYKTRLIVRRPADPRDANGSIVVEWWNSTGTFDIAPVWDASAEFFAREGWSYVGITNSNVPITFLRGGCRLGGIIPVANCRQRYATLSLPENGQAYDVVSQIVHALRQGGNSPLPGAYPVERVFHAGQSQQGGSIITYASDFHFEDNDGYFVQVAALGRAINFGPVCGSAGAPAYPDCTPALQGPSRFVRTDLPVPVIQALSETDVSIPFGAVTQGSRQADTRTYRYYEMAGTSHAGVHKGVEIIPNFLTLEDTCLHPLNTHADGPVFGSYLLNAMWSNLERQVRGHVRPPPGKPISLVDGTIERDAFGNAIGGLRLPELELPVATYLPSNVVDEENIPAILQPALPLLNLFCNLAGSIFPFDEATLAALYPSQAKFVQRYRQYLRNLVARRYLLEEDAEKLEAALQPPSP
jgi:hypothetical protein